MSTTDTLCIPANPDISGIGVRIAIYAQTLLCFAPIISYLKDGRISRKELEATKERSADMIYFGLAILISIIIQAKEKTTGNDNLISSYQAVIILNLSWMSNTSTFVWLLLYVHHRSKPEEGKDQPKPVEATWAAWFRDGIRDEDLLFGINGGLNKDEGSRLKAVPGFSSRKQMQFFQFMMKLIMMHVTFFGTLHLTFMASLGLWLWRDPSKFGTRLSCDPSLSIVGVPVPFSSRTLRVWSIFIYSLLLPPGDNFIIPLFFFLSLHIFYNWLRKHYTKRRANCDEEVNGTAMDGFSSESNASNAPASKAAAQVHTGSLLVGLAILFAINVVFLVDTELTLARNKAMQHSGESEWGFGQILSLVLIVVPAYGKFAMNLAGLQKEQASERLRKLLASPPSPDDNSIKRLILRGADPNLQYESKDQGRLTVLQHAAYEGREDLVRYLLDHGAQIDLHALNCASEMGHTSCVRLLIDRGANFNMQGADCRDTIRAASQKWHVETAFFLIQRSNEKDVQDMLHGLDVAKVLQDSRLDFRQAALKRIARLPKNGEPFANVRKAIPAIVHFLKDEDDDVRYAAAKAISALAEHLELHAQISLAEAAIAGCLTDRDEEVRRAAQTAIARLSDPAHHAGLHEERKEPLSGSREQYVAALSSPGVKDEALVSNSEPQDAIPSIVLRLSSSDAVVRRDAVEAISCRADSSETHEDIQKAVPSIVKCLEDVDENVRQAAIECLSALALFAELRAEMKVLCVFLHGHINNSIKVEPHLIDCLLKVVLRIS